MAAEPGKEMRDQAQELMTQGKEVAAEYYEEGRNQVIAWQQQLEDQVREKPAWLPEEPWRSRLKRLAGRKTRTTPRGDPILPFASRLHFAS